MRWFHLLFTFGAVYWSGPHLYCHGLDLSIIVDTLVGPLGPVPLRCGLELTKPICNSTSGECHCPKDYPCERNYDCFEGNDTSLIRVGLDCVGMPELYPSCCWKRCSGDTAGYCRCQSSGLLGCRGGDDGIAVYNQNC
ncbi:uncharacterized protein LOC110859127 [Folsomia candida]|uniref:uncharacterized protein LOC110859127 n=1 Tax=Folsomia candida TaxID=158441 RepID=UPI000B8FA9BC|nr:uncharacterized protein LOC110859127 [Folsomia candida]